MEIAVLNPFFYPYTGGTERVIFELYRRLAKRDNITVITSELPGKRLPKEEDIEGIHIVRLRSDYIYTNGIFPLPFLFMHGIRGAIRKADAEIYHINNRYQYFIETTREIKNMNRKIALTLHNALPSNIDPFTDGAGLFYDLVWGRYIMHKSDLITGVSKSTIETTVPDKERKKAFVIYNGVDTKVFRPLSGSDRFNGVRKNLGFDEMPIIVTTGRLITQKGQIYLIRALEKLKRDGEIFNLLILGKGPLQSLLYKEARRLGVEDRVKISSAETEEQVVKYYNTVDMFALPSLYEPASIAILEALSCSLPSGASRIGGIPEMMRDCGRYFEPRDVKGIAKSISEIMNDKNSSARNARKGRKLMLKYHNWDSIAKDYRGRFKSILNY